MNPKKEKGIPEASDGRTIEAIREQLSLFELIFENINNGCIVTDPDGYVTHFNKPYGEFLGIDPAIQIGRHCTEVVENSRMHIVARQGRPEINEVQRISGKQCNMVVQRIPIRQNGRVVAVFGQVMFKDVEELERLVRKLSVLETKVRLYEEELFQLRSTRYTIDSIVGPSPAMAELRKEALLAADNGFPVLIMGESGTGKELFAQSIHNGSQRKIHPFVRINCAAIPKDLLESELFGYERGAFTGARSRGKAGKIELAHQGTLFLDEIGDLPLAMQPKLLNVLEEKVFERVGGTTLLQSNFRLIAATNQNLEKMMADGRFRKDLFYRLNVIPLIIPPLRERPRDIAPIVHHFLGQLAREGGMPDLTVAPSALAALEGYAWPGNVREVLNVLERTLARLSGCTIQRDDLPFYLKQDCRAPVRDSCQPSIREVSARAERDAIRFALDQTGNNKSAAARRLGIHRTLLYKKIRKYGLAL
ncbi:MAG: sigma 54-interacting transcriptional regulator [Desulfosarcina sp.]